MAQAMPRVVSDRLFKRVYICMKCNAHMRADPMRIREHKIKCRKCDNKKFRPKKRLRKATGK